VAKYFPLQAGFGAPRRQSRWKVAFRLILALPLLVWFFLLSIAAGFLIIIGWFATLVLGRLPYSFVRPLSDYIVFGTRLFSYTFLMNDAYPPFSDKRDYGVNLAIPSSKVRRLTVLFRIVLIIPAAIVSTLITSGVQVAAIFIWLIVLAKGEMPLPLFGAMAAILRYQARFYAYYMMITNKYPGELFGDQPTAESEFSAASESVLSPNRSITDTPTHFDPHESVSHESTWDSVGSSVGEDATNSSLPIAPGAPTGPPTEFTTEKSSSGSEEPPRTARLVLSQGSKRILVTLLILGVLGYSAEVTLESRLHDNQSALQRLTLANGTLNSEIASAKAQRTGCSLAANVCIQQYFSTVAYDFSSFEAALDNTSFPSGTQSDAVQFEGATRSFVALLELLKSESSVPQAQLNQLATLGNSFDTDFNQVVSDLSSPI
jgi:Domain of unknown function (DUF4389)